MRTTLWIRAAGWFLLALAACAQDGPFRPAPRVLQIYREQVRPGREQEYVKVETETVAMEARLKFAHSYLTLQSVTGPSDVWYLNGFDTYTTIEEIGAQVAANPELSAELNRVAERKGDLVMDPRTVMLHLREDMSYGHGMSGQATRYFSIATVLVEPGQVDQFAEIRRLIRDAHERAGVKDIHTVYEVQSGMREGTFLVVTPAATLGEAGYAQQRERRAVDSGLDQAGRARLRDLSRAAILQSETSLFVISPEMSYPARAWVAAEPEFWKTKLQ